MRSDIVLLERSGRSKRGLRDSVTGAEPRSGSIHYESGGPSSSIP
jgi:hypothetical protein